MKHSHKKPSKILRHSLFFLMLLLCMLSPAGQSLADEDIDIQAITQETQKMSKARKDMTFVWWLPEQFWQASMRQDPSANKTQAEEFLKIIRPYTMIAVVDGKMGSFGGVTYRSEEAVRAGVTIRDTRGATYTPLRESEIAPDMKNLLMMLKPIIVNMIGPMGQNMHFFLFPSRNKEGQPLADPEKEGLLRVLIEKKEFRYRLPLGSILPPKYDPKTEEKFPGNYNYNPFTGSKLVREHPQKPPQPTQ